MFPSRLVSSCLQGYAAAPFLLLLLAFGYLGISAAFGAEVKVYRCTDADGHIEFSQQACARGEQQRLHVDISNSGWRPAVPKRQRHHKAKKAREQSKPRNVLPVQDARGIKECWGVRKNLKKIEWQMRRGYKSGEGAGLRRQRREYEDYLRAFCNKS